MHASTFGGNPIAARAGIAALEMIEQDNLLARADKLGDYFRTRLSEVRRDVEHGLEITLDHHTTRVAQERVLEILKFKLDILWTMLDSMWMAYIENKPPFHNC